MPHVLQQSVETIRRRAWRTMLTSAVSWLLVSVLAVTFVLGWLDYWLRFRDPGVRLIVSIGWLAGAVYSVKRFVWPVFQTRWPATLIAQRIERVCPELQGRLASSIDFLSQDANDPLAGSPQLRRTVIAETTAVFEKADLSRVLDQTESRRALWAAGVAVVSVLLVSALDVRSAALATWRIVAPLGTADWPRRNRLEFVELPDRLALGGDFEATVVDRNGASPPDATLWIWYDGDDAAAVQRHLLRPLGESLVYRLEQVNKSFRFRATGGDDDAMPWHSVTVVEPPRITKAQTRLVPPPYTGFPPEIAGQQIRAIVGTRIEVEATSDKPLAAVRLRADGQRNGSDDVASSAVPVRLAAGGSQFTVPATDKQPWLVTETRTFGFELTDLDGLRGGDNLRWQIRAIPDAPPTVSVQQPGPNTVATATAMLKLRLTVKDDLAVHKVCLRYTRSDQPDADEQSLDVFQGPELHTPKPLPTPDAKFDAGDSRSLEFAWDISKLGNLAAGTTLEFFVEATDYKPQSGRSPSQRIAIISPDDLEDKIVQRQALILSQLHEVLRLERDCRSQTKSLEIQLQETGSLTRKDVDLLQSAELNQRQVLRQLGDGGDGTQTQIASLLNDLETNRVANTEVAHRLTLLLGEVSRLNRDVLPNIERDLIAATKIARQAVEAGKSSQAAGQPVTSAAQRQDEVIQTLERLLGELSQWDHYRRFGREVNRLRRDQEKLIEQTTERFTAQFANKDPDKLAPQDAAELRRLAERQQELARRFDKLQSQMRQMRDELKESDPLAAQTLSDALDTADRTAASGDLRQAGQNLSRNRTGQATESQKKAATSLSEIENVLANRREQELERITKKLAETAQELASLANRQTGLRKQMEQAAKISNEAARKRELQRLTKEQQRLADETAQVARKLQRLQAQAASDATKQANSRQQQASQAGNQADAAKSLEEMQQAEKHLEEAQQQLAQARQQAEQDLANEQLARLEQLIVGLLNRQKAVVAEVARLAALRREQQDQLSEAQLTSLQLLAQQQRDIATDASAFTSTISQAEAFVLGLRGAVRDMSRAATLFDQRQTGGDAQDAAQHAATRLEQLLAALKPEKSPADNPPQPPGNGDDNQPMPSQQTIHTLAELKLLRLMQAEINRRTSELAARRKNNAPLPAEQQRELEQLAEEQGGLADLVLKLVRQMTAESPPDESAVPELAPPKENQRRRPAPANLDDLDDALKQSLEKK